MRVRGCACVFTSGIALANGAEITVTMNEGYPAVVNSSPTAVETVEAGTWLPLHVLFLPCSFPPPCAL